MGIPWISANDTRAEYCGLCHCVTCVTVEKAKRHHCREKVILEDPIFPRAKVLFYFSSPPKIFASTPMMQCDKV